MEPLSLEGGSDEGEKLMPGMLMSDSFTANKAYLCLFVPLPALFMCVCVFANLLVRKQAKEAYEEGGTGFRSMVVESSWLVAFRC